MIPWRICVSRNVVFFKNQYFFQHHVDNPDPISTVPLLGFSDDETFVKFNPSFVYHRRCNEPTIGDPPLKPLPASSPPISLALRRSTHVTKPHDRYGFSHTSLMATLSTTYIPHSYSQVVQHECWKQAMQNEFDALAQNHTWDIVQCPASVKPIGNKWVYSPKLKPDGSLDRYKASLVTLGN
eukprot:TRINITY_DN29317_c1_g1_i1.p1 TRINITY_DN29317_c1_g1~~TRINITY_DN29317_c1_g1_i1.p1  ORF type:complete len:182 (-),score=14.95 TRINITY_DN29317_c1_g1_i1:1275-1820(-)